MLQLAQRLLQLLFPDRLGALTNGANRVDALPAIDPSFEIARGHRDQVLDLADLALVLLAILLLDRLQGIDVTNDHEIIDGYRLIDHPRHADVDHEQRRVAMGDMLRPDHRCVGRRRTDHQRGRRDRILQRIERQGKPVNRFGQLRRVLPRPVHDADFAHPARMEKLCRQRRHLAGAKDRDGDPLQPVQLLLGEIDGRMGNGHAVSRDVRFRPRALADPERIKCQPLQHRADRLTLPGMIERILDLRQDLRLAEHHRVEATRDPENVIDRLLPALDVGGTTQCIGLELVVAREELDHIALDVLRRLPDGVDFGPVARRQNHALRDMVLERIEPFAKPLARKSEAFTYLDGRIFVVGADDNDHRGRRHRVFTRCGGSGPHCPSMARARSRTAHCRMIPQSRAAT